MAVYFAKNPLTGLVKIGKSFMVNDRLKGLSRENEAQLELLGVVPGSLHEEHDLHLQFSSSKSTGEWFHPTSELLEFIDTHGLLLNELIEKPRPDQKIETKLAAPLIEILTVRRLDAGKKIGQSLAYDRFTQRINDQMNGPTLYRFIQGTKRFGVVYLRMIAAWANESGDAELLRVLALYALGVNMEPVDN